jgi:hypothetical protein
MQELLARVVVCAALYAYNPALLLRSCEISPLSCYYHPNAQTVATCKLCGLGLCGMCTRFLDDGNYCEKCETALESEATVSKYSDQLNSPRDEVRSFTSTSEEFKEAFPTTSRDKDRGIIMLGVGGSFLMIFMSLAMYAFPNLFEFDSELLAQREAEQALEDCRLVFEEIGYLLEDGELPDASMTCSGTNTPNIVRRQGEIVSVYHPNPTLHGLTEMYVTSEDHEVILVRGQG